jgi:hypothetical protein
MGAGAGAMGLGSLLKQVDDKESIAMRRRMAGWNPNFLAKVLGIPTT